MNRRFPIIIPVLIGVAVLAALFWGANMLRRNNQQPGQNNTVQYNRNFVRGNMRGASPNAALDGRNTPQGNQNKTNMDNALINNGNQDGKLGNNLYNAKNMGANLSPGNNNMGMGRMGQDLQRSSAFDIKKAENIRNQLNDIDGVRELNAVVQGNTALIGYDPDGNATDGNAIKNMIVDRVKQIDNTITDVVVTDSRDFFTQIKQLGEKIKRNMSTDEINNEFNQLMQNITNNR